MDETIKIDPLLEVFLLETHSYDQFVQNVKNRDNKAFDYAEIPCKSISSSFFWDETKEGIEYWAELNHQFINLSNY